MPPAHRAEVISYSMNITTVHARITPDLWKRYISNKARGKLYSFQHFYKAEENLRNILTKKRASRDKYDGNQR